MHHSHPDSLSDQALKWIIASVDPKAKVHSVHKLKGATSSTIFRISLLINQTLVSYVLRQFTNREWLCSEPDLALHEAQSLLCIGHGDLSTPKLMAYDETGSNCGVPAVLMSHLEGRVVLTPKDMDSWLNELAKALAQIHAIPADNFSWTYHTYTDISSFEVPSWSDYPELWGLLIRNVKQPAPKDRPCFIHRDYHPANVLWNKDKISGIVDWVNACKGSAGIDVGHCRANLAMLYGVETANAFLLAYEKLTGSSFQYHHYWDLISLIDILEVPPKVYQGWIDFGIKGLTDQLIKERIDNYALHLSKTRF